MSLDTAATLDSQTGQVPLNPTFVIRLSFVGDASYATGGSANFQAFVRAAVSGRAVEVMDVIAGDCGDNVPYYDKTNDKLLTRVISTAAEVANTTNLSGVTFNVTVLCQ